MMNGKVTEFHRHFRRLRGQGMTKIQALTAAKKSHWADYKAMCIDQENGVLLEPLDEKDEARIMQIRLTGRLI
jgi:hypothetical protein